MGYVWAFLASGLVCVLAQLLYEYTKWTPAHVLVLLTVTGAILEGLGVYRLFQNWAGGGALVPVSGFGASIARGVVAEGQRMGWEGLFSGVFEYTGLGLAAAIIAGFFIALVAKPKE
ncbi:MAG: SpoVA/SpoVAEb family sporulation membrane protein [Firmicutes bacterium]|jgi:stage V sporulation protein AE|nr:SpoVA/SpoVAEb family sporulation membrane protein [Bacillota bacterium]